MAPPQQREQPTGNAAARTVTLLLPPGETFPPRYLIQVHFLLEHLATCEGQRRGRLELQWHQQREVQPAAGWSKKKLEPAQVFHWQPPADIVTNTEKVHVGRLPGQKLQLHAEGWLSLNVTCFRKQLHVLTQFFAYFKFQTQHDFCSANRPETLEWLWGYPVISATFALGVWSPQPPPLLLYFRIITISSFLWKWWTCKTATAKSHSCILFEV